MFSGRFEKINAGCDSQHDLDSLLYLLNYLFSTDSVAFSGKDLFTIFWPMNESVLWRYIASPAPLPNKFYCRFVWLLYWLCWLNLNSRLIRWVWFKSDKQTNPSDEQRWNQSICCCCFKKESWEELNFLSSAWIPTHFPLLIWTGCFEISDFMRLLKKQNKNKITLLFVSVKMCYLSTDHNVFIL